MKVSSKIKWYWRKIFRPSRVARYRGYVRDGVKNMGDTDLRYYTANALEWYDLRKNNHPMNNREQVEDWKILVNCCTEAIKEMRRRGLRLPK